jgi:hypothetical protein
MDIKRFNIAQGIGPVEKTPKKKTRKTAQEFIAHMVPSVSTQGTMQVSEGAGG